MKNSAGWREGAKNRVYEAKNLSRRVRMTDQWFLSIPSSVALDTFAKYAVFKIN